MGKLRFNIAVSLDGYSAGPNQSVDDPVGEGGMRLHEWAFEARAWREAVPVLLGGGTRLLEALGDEPPALELLTAVDAAGVTHLKYRVVK